jgi:NADH-quinone oxidoreductase subunit H
MPAELNFWIIPLVLTLVIVFGFPLVVGYIVLWERKVLADMQVRLGPMRVGPHGLLQPLADALKLVLKEDITPTESDRAVFWAAPVMAVVVALLSLAIIPFGPGLRVADPGVGVLWRSSWPAGPPTAITRCWVRCGRRRS